ncbi:MAG: helix-turn-helix domain-containing protein, partial [Treponemataceae bacterium]|nr:helix-turn-helix domain-containing protein [Treponemataceae bacterium]
MRFLFQKFSELCFVHSSLSCFSIENINGKPLNNIMNFRVVCQCCSMYFVEMIEQEYQEQLDFVLARLREERLKANMSQIELSFAAGLSQNQVNCIESGRNIPN